MICVDRNFNEVIGLTPCESCIYDQFEFNMLRVKGVFEEDIVTSMIFKTYGGILLKDYQNHYKNYQNRVLE